jgi:hypothetical protein
MVPDTVLALVQVLVLTMVATLQLRALFMNPSEWNL